MLVTSGVVWRYAERLQNIPQRDDTFELVYVRAAYYREDGELVGAHAVEGYVERLVGVDVREVGNTCQVCQ